MEKLKLKRFEPLEKDVQESVCQYLAAKRYFFWRQNNFSIYDSTIGEFRRLPKWAKKGVPDIIMVKDGQFIGIEIKRPTTSQDPAQIEFERDLKKAGGRYYVIRRIEDLTQIGL